MQLQMPKTLEWIGDSHGFLRLLDQTQLPAKVAFKDCLTLEDVHEAIKALRVRGAPAIGIAAAWGCVLGIATKRDLPLLQRFEGVSQFLKTSRPTAVNLFWAIDRMGVKFQELLPLGEGPLVRGMMSEAQSMENEDRNMCLDIGRYGQPLIPSKANILTHCNTGFLATAGRGTALSVIFTAFELGKKLHVYCDETRPLFQGARLTGWELMQAGIPATLICDSMAALVMKEKKVDLVITGADRIAANGDCANKVGTYGLAVLAKAHEIPFYVAAPSTTFDMDLLDGQKIPIEERPKEEITQPCNYRVAPPGIEVYNPAFDVTPASLITALITEKGVIQPIGEETIRKCLSKKSPTG